MKRIPVSDRIQQIMQANLGTVPDVNAIAVFETVAADSSPLNKKGTIWEKAVMPASFLQELAGFVRPNDTVPLQLMHERGVLPVGRVFHAEFVDGAVRALFYTTDMQLAANIDNAVVDSVSVGLEPKHLNCSECGWDFLGADASFLNFMDRTCANDHVVGTDGVHVNLNGVQQWMELSAVPRGADPTAKIVNRAKSLLSDENRTRLAASNIPAEAHILFAQRGVTTDMLDPTILARLEAQATEIATLKASATAFDAVKTELTAAQHKNTELATQVATLTAQVADLIPKVTAVAATTAFLAEQAKRALVATQKATENMPTDDAGLIAILTASQKNIVNLVPADGVSDAANSGKGEAKVPGAPRSAFTNRNLKTA